jgi:hypothetical protein
MTDFLTHLIDDKGDESTKMIDKSFNLDETGNSKYEHDHDHEAYTNQLLEKALSDIVYIGSIIFLLIMFLEYT